MKEVGVTWDMIPKVDKDRVKRWKSNQGYPQRPIVPSSAYNALVASHFGLDCDKIQEKGFWSAFAEEAENRKEGFWSGPMEVTYTCPELEEK